MRIDKTTQDAFHTGQSKDFRTEREKIREEDFIAELLNNETLYNFACTILYKMIQHAKKVGSSKKEIINIIVGSNLKNIIIKLGYTAEQSEKAHGFTNFEDFKAWNKEHNISLLQLTSAFYKFQEDNTFIRRCIEYDKELQKKFMQMVYTYFKVPESMSYDEFKTSIIEKSYGSFFYVWVLIYLKNSKPNLLRRNLDNDADYVRYWNRGVKLKTGSLHKLKTHTLKKKNIKYDQLPNIYYPKKTIIRGNTYKAPRENGIWFNIMRKYKKEIIAGPSGSALYTYQIIFDTAKILSHTLQNKILLLLCIIADYSKYYHSISEILQTYTTEASLPLYTLDMNDINYLRKLQKSFRGAMGPKTRKTRKMGKMGRVHK